MKKILLTIPEPCHEDWEKMNKVEKGKFCGSCQKMVIDFTSMSDRQLAEFFRHPNASTCGRFYEEQLNREIYIPPKKIPWAKYLFHIVWPAFVLLFKSCSPRETKGDKSVFEIVSAGFRSGGGKTSIGSPNVNNEHIKQAVSDTNKNGKLNEDLEDHILSAAPMDTVFVKAAHGPFRSTIIAGGISRVAVGKVLRNTSIEKNEDMKNNYNPRIFPNPIRNGSGFNVSSAHSTKLVEIISGSGQVVYSYKPPASESNQFFVAVPTALTAGVYFLRLSGNNNKTMATEKLVIQ